VLLHSTSIDADTLRRLVAAAGRTAETTEAEAEELATRNVEPFQRFHPRHGQISVSVEVLSQVADAARCAADAVAPAEPAWAETVRDDLRTAETACGLVRGFRLRRATAGGC
jgi:hypothetical protein